MYGILKNDAEIFLEAKKQEVISNLLYAEKKRSRYSQGGNRAYVWQTFGNNKTSFCIDFHHFVKTWLYGSRVLCAVKQCRVFQQVVMPFLFVSLLDLPFSITRGLSLSLLKLSLYIISSWKISHTLWRFQWTQNTRGQMPIRDIFSSSCHSCCFAPPWQLMSFERLGEIVHPAKKAWERLSLL